MKRYLLSVFFILTGLMLVACGGGGGSAGTPSGSASPTNFKVNAPAEVTLALGQTVSYAITGGLTPYTVTNSAPGFVNATVSGQTLTVTAVKVGTSELTVSPQGGGATANIKFSVVSSLTSLQVQAPDKITLRPGNSGIYLVSGGTPPYRVVSSNSGVVSASIVGESLRLDGVGVGTSEVQIFDATGSAPVKRDVDVIVAAALFSSAPSSLTISTGGTRSYSIGGGLRLTPQSAVMKVWPKSALPEPPCRLTAWWVGQLTSSSATPPARRSPLR